MVDFVHVNNLVQAHMLAGIALDTVNSIAVSMVKLLKALRITVKIGIENEGNSYCIII